MHLAEPVSQRPLPKKPYRPRPWSDPWPATRPSSAWRASSGSVALGLSLVGVVPFGVLGAPLAIILAATALGLLMSTIWAAAVGQSAVAAVFGIFGTFWLSYAVLVLGLDHSWFAIAVTAALATVKLFLLTWFVIIVMLTLATLRLASAFTGGSYSQSPSRCCCCTLGSSRPRPLGVPSSGLLKRGWVHARLRRARRLVLDADPAQVPRGPAIVLRWLWAE